MRLKPCVIVLSGLPLTGKSTLAHAIALRCNGIALDVDHIRQEKFPNPERILLAPEEELRVMVYAYSELIAHACRILHTGRPVILAGTFSREEFKKPLRELKEDLEKAGVPLRVFRLSASDQAIEQRIRQRQQEDRLSNIDTLEKFRWAQGLFKSIEFVPVVEIDTTKPCEECLKVALFHLQDIQARLL